MADTKYPSVDGLKCPQCGKTEFKILGTKGSLAKAGVAVAFGAIANMALDSQSKSDFEIKPVRYQCLGCKNKFEADPLVAPEEEVLAEPCKVVFHKPIQFILSLVRLLVFLTTVHLILFSVLFK